MVLSGMGTTAMMEDNIHTFTNFVPLNEQERQATDLARAYIREARQIPCTACNYCADVCPKQIPVSEILAIRNQVLGAKITAAEGKELFPKERSTAADCIQCGKCEGVCPQSIPIKEHLEKTAKW